jgi:hypothetical protein
MDNWEPDTALALMAETDVRGERMSPGSSIPDRLPTLDIPDEAPSTRTWLNQTSALCAQTSDRKKTGHE